MAKVGIVMGSDSDMPVMAKAADILDKLGIDYEMNIISAHREPEEFFAYAKTAPPHRTPTRIMSHTLLSTSKNKRFKSTSKAFSFSIAFSFYNTCSQPVILKNK